MGTLLFLEIPVLPPSFAAPAGKAPGEGIPAGAPMFIPFVGAVIAMRGMPKDGWVEALVGIGGPVLGGAGAAACLAK